MLAAPIILAGYDVNGKLTGETVISEIGKDKDGWGGQQWIRWFKNLHPGTVSVSVRLGVKS